MLIVDDHPAVRAGVRRLLAGEPGIVVAGEADSAGAAATAASRRPPDVAIVDYHLGDRSGLWVSLRLGELQPRPRVLIYSAFADGAVAAAAIVAGADGVLAKSSIASELVIAVRRLCEGRPYLPVISRTLTLSLGACLGDQERELFDLLVHGLAPAEVATRLQITAAELASRRERILAALAPAAARSRLRSTTHRPLEYGGARSLRLARLRSRAIS